MHFSGIYLYSLHGYHSSYLHYHWCFVHIIDRKRAGVPLKGFHEKPYENEVFWWEKVGGQ